MLVALITIWLLGGGGAGSSTAGYVDQLTNYAKTQIANEAQRKAVLDAAKELKRAGIQEAKANASAADAVITIAKSREAKLQDFEAPLSQSLGYSIELQNKLVQQRFRLKAELTRDQWTALHASSRSAVR